MSLGVLTALVTTAAAGFVDGTPPREHGSAESSPALHRGDAFEVTVREVSDVDSFEGLEPATGLFFHARVAGIRRTAGCWLTESRAAAQNLLRGKNVRLTVKNDGVPGNGEIAVDVQLPDGSDYAKTVVREGMASVDPASRDELATVEVTAREERRGLWAAACVTSTTTAASTTSSTPSPTTTTTTPAPEPSAPPSWSVPRIPTTSVTPPSDFVDPRLGKLCFIEGSRRTSQDGTEMVCARNAKNQLRWQRAD
ncbi:thermonuclease family protein [Lentzea alba]|uniref:thermonuclease family protein n=1 Tax=Lentzea alba TaxID=2714351 RepID=UPI0039BFFDE6